MGSVQVWGTIVGIAASFMVIFSGLLAVLFRGIRAWSAIDRKLTILETLVTTHVGNSDATHRSIVESLTHDRQATDERLRFLERNQWNNPGSRHAGTA